MRGNQKTSWVLQKTGQVKFETSKACDSLCSRGEAERDADEAVYVVDAGEGRIVLRILGLVSNDRFLLIIGQLYVVSF